MKYETKLQSTGGTLSTSIPKTIRDILELEKGDTIEWIINISNTEKTAKIYKK